MTPQEHYDNIKTQRIITENKIRKLEDKLDKLKEKEERLLAKILQCSNISQSETKQPKD